MKTLFAFLLALVGIVAFSSPDAARAEAPNCSKLTLGRVVPPPISWTPG